MWNEIVSGAKDLTSGVLQETIGTDFGLGGGPTAAGAAVAKRTPNQTAMMGSKPAANPEGVAPYMNPTTKGPAIGDQPNADMKKKKRKAIGQVAGGFEEEMMGKEGIENINKMDQMTGMLDKMFDPTGETGVKATAEGIQDEIESKEPISQMEKDAVDLGADIPKKDEFDLQDFGRLLASVPKNKGPQARSNVQATERRRGGMYKSKGLWDQRIAKEWMDLFNKPLYTPLHEVARKFS